MYFLLSVLFATTTSAGSLLDEPGVGGQFETARSVGMGGAQRAIADQIDAIYLNPAGMSVKPHYLLGGTFNWSPEPKEYVGSAAIVDSATTSVAAGLSYGFDRRDNPATGVMDIHRFYVATGYSFGGVVSIGITFKYITYKREHPARMLQVDQDLLNGHGVNHGSTGSQVAGYPADYATGYSNVLKGAADYNFDVGMLVTPIPQVSLAVVGYNLKPDCTQSVPQADPKQKNAGFPNNVPGGCSEREIAPLAMAIALSANIAGLQLGADAVFDFWSKPNIGERFHFGAEYTLFDLVPLRAGAIVDRIQSEIFWTAGAGIALTQFGFDFAFREGINDPDNRTLVGSIKLNLN